MKDLPRVSSTPAGVDLGPLGAFGDGESRGVVIVTDATRFHGFILRRADQVVGYVDRCPHAGLPLARQLDEYLTPDGDHIQCAWHGALFEPVTGLCVAGPCVGARLSGWPLEVRDGRLFSV